MTTSYPSPLHTEWATLQQDHERHERCAVGIKIAAVALTAGAALFGFPLELAAPLIAIVWVIEAMLRTVQGRLGQRLLKVETLIADGASEYAACQLHTEWQATRPGAVGLLMEYAKSALKPTVAFPYPLLIILSFVLSLPG
ncbi:hypothetical protein NMQ14_08010 [Methyloversatilis sp. XJ19-13]|uniref:hypothetical protein n=1 Tax=Methyloversatilis sp. XJ19-13 TaxID=2963430 RepID=UPI00211CE008|nr:hypothetical protein [Methyloversatilis sp. XJ19-13]MCQ9374189.1 hypothetical protein [Methyloversatilis sp. XJ19-13]